MKKPKKKKNGLGEFAFAIFDALTNPANTTPEAVALREIVREAVHGPLRKSRAVWDPATGVSRYDPEDNEVFEE